MDSSNASVDDYEVFLSFRGVDTRQGFTDVLHEFMTTVEIRVFRDDDELAIGDKIESILEAIHSSRICIPIFSPKFAESKWCLREVSRMVDLKKTIVPIFYKVSPDDVKLKGASVYSNDFRKLEESHGNREEVEKWKKALKEAASNKGRILGNNSYTRFCKEFVDGVLSKLGPRKWLDLDYFVGEKNKEAVIKSLDMTSSNKEVVCIGIYGMGGIGKTTITKLIYNEFLSRFDHCGFLPDIREFCGRQGIKKLPKYLYTNLEPKPNMKISRSDQIPGIFKNKKVLLILDDVDSYEQIKEIAREPSWFGSGSRIILTTRDKKVFEDYIVPQESKSEFRCLEMMVLERVSALELFSKCAFETDSPPPYFQELSERVVAYAEGLPLTITVIGKYLRNQRNVEVWEDFIERVRKSPPKEVKDKLMISYQSLEDEQKTIFLDIACFFIDSYCLIEEHSNLLYMWKACHLLPNLSLQVLQSRCLVKIDEEGSIWMHDQLRDLGRDIVKKNSEGDITQQSRLWEMKDIQEVLKYKEKKKNTEAIQLGYGPGKSEKIQLDHNDTSFIHSEFFGFDNLRFLSLGHPNLRQKISGNLPQLRWLSSQADFLVENLVLPNLGALDFVASDVDENWSGWNKIQELELKSIKLLDMSFCDYLRGTPVFTQNMAALERLEMGNCYDLVYVDPSIHELQNLTYLSLINCHALSELPEELGRLGNLTELQLSCCNHLSKIPESIGNLHSLRELSLDSTSITSLPDSIGGLEKLNCLNMEWCKSLVSLPDSLGNLRSLIRLNISHTKITELPSSIGRLQKLEYLDLQELHITQLPDSFGDLSSLVNLKLSGSKIIQLQETPELPTNLTKIEIKYGVLSKVHDLSNMQDLTSLKLSGGHILDWDGSFPANLQSLSICISSIFKLPDLSNCSHLTKFKLQCEYSLKVLPNLSGLRKLDELEIVSCHELIEIPGIGNLQSLTSLHVESLQSLLSLEDLSELQQLKHFKLVGCQKLKGISGLGNLRGLTTLKVENCDSLVSLENVGELKELRMFNLIHCQRLTDIPGLGGLRSLTELSVEDCNSLERLDGISGLEELKQLSLIACRMLTKIPGLFSLKSLRLLNIQDCYSIDILVAASQLQKLHCVEVLGMPNSDTDIWVSSFDQMKKMARDMEVNNGNRPYHELSLIANLRRFLDDQATGEVTNFPQEYNHKKRKGFS